LDKKSYIFAAGLIAKHGDNAEVLEKLKREAAEVPKPSSLLTYLHKTLVRRRGEATGAIRALRRK
jgi:hypothetical protein